MLLLFLMTLTTSAPLACAWGFGNSGFGNFGGFGTGFSNTRNGFFNNFACYTQSCQEVGFTNGYVAAGCAIYNQAICAAAGGTCAFTRCGYLCCRNNTVVVFAELEPLPDSSVSVVGNDTVDLFTNNVGACNERGTVFGTEKCNGRTECGPNQACLNGVCCPKGALASDYACGGEEAVARCFGNNTCGLNYNCVDGYCCECPAGRQNGRCSTVGTVVGCPANTTCDASGWCCDNVDPGVINTGSCPNNAIPNGNCVNRLCPLSFNCVGTVCCPSI